MIWRTGPKSRGGPPRRSSCGPRWSSPRCSCWSCGPPRSSPRWSGGAACTRALAASTSTPQPAITDLGIFIGNSSGHAYKKGIPNAVRNPLVLLFRPRFCGLIPLYQELYLPYTRRLLTCVTDTCRQRCTQAQHAVDGLLLIAGVGDLIDQRRTHHHAIGQARDGGRLLRRADTKTDADRQVGMATQAGHGFFDVYHGAST